MVKENNFDFKEVKDSGERQEFDTGSVRDTRRGKGRYDLMSPIALRRIAKHYENGAVKYGDRNWEKGQPISRYLDSAIRHCFDFLEGKRDEDHVAAAAWNLMAIMHTQEMIERGNLPDELNDMPDFTEKDLKTKEFLTQQDVERSILSLIKNEEVYKGQSLSEKSLHGFLNRVEPGLVGEAIENLLENDKIKKFKNQITGDREFRLTNAW